MAEFLTDPSVLTKDKLKSALVANNVALPNGDQRKGVYVELYLKNLTSQNKQSGTAEAFSSDEEPSSAVASITARSGRKATKKTDRVRPEEMDVTELTDEDLKDQLVKYGVNPGPILASTRKVYEKKLQKLLDQGPPQISVSETVLTHSSRNGNADSDQYSDKEEESTMAIPEPYPQLEPEPVPVTERPLRSRGKTPVTTRTRSSQHSKEEDNDESEEESIVHLVNIKRKSRRSSRRSALDDSVLDSLYKKSPVPAKAVRPSSPSWHQDRKRCESAAAVRKASGEDVQLSLLDTALLDAALLEVDPRNVLSAGPGHVCPEQPSSPPLSSSRPSGDPIRTTRRLSPSRGKDSPRSASRGETPWCPADQLPVCESSCDTQERSDGSSAALQSRIDEVFSPITPIRGQDYSRGDRTPGGPIEKLTAVEQTPKPAREPDVLKELFPNEVFNTPTGISATRRQPIRGAAGRPFSNTWQDSLRPRLTEHRYTTSSYTETRSVPRVSPISLSSPLSVPLSIPKPAAPQSVQTKAKRRVPVWVQLLLLAAITGFLLFVYHTMESNQTSPFGQTGPSNTLDDARK